MRAKPACGFRCAGSVVGQFDCDEQLFTGSAASRPATRPARNRNPPLIHFALALIAGETPALPVRKLCERHRLTHYAAPRNLDTTNLYPLPKIRRFCAQRLCKSHAFRHNVSTAK